MSDFKSSGWYGALLIVKLVLLVVLFSISIFIAVDASRHEKELREDIKRMEAIRALKGGKQ